MIHECPLLRLSSGAAFNEMNTTNQNSFDPFFLEEIGPLLGTKCDVCVLSEETQVFRLLDAILESNLWPLEPEKPDKEDSEESLTQAQIIHD